MNSKMPLLLLVVLLLGGGLFAWRRDSDSNPFPSAPLPAPKLQIPPAAAVQRRPTEPAGSRPVRVAVTPVAVEQLAIAVDGPFQVRLVGSREIIGEGKRLASTNVTVTPSGLSIGGHEYPASRLEIVADRSPSIWVDAHQYRGRIRLLRRPGNRLIAVNVVPLEEYVAGVVDGEMPASFPTAARRAQAVVARTFARYQMHVSKNRSDFDLYATTRSQRYLGYQYRDGTGRRLAGESADSRRVAGGTAGMVCTWRGELFCTYYSAVCGGRTTPGANVFSDAAVPLQSVPCRWCRPARRYRWESRIKKSVVSDALRKFFRSNGRPFGKLVALTVEHATRSGAQPFLSASDGRHRYRIAADQLRRHLTELTLYSPKFTVHEEDGSLVFHGRGHGHGVGLCQWGARGLALAGRNETEIIRYYYPGAQVGVAPSSPPVVR